MPYRHDRHCAQRSSQFATASTYEQLRQRGFSRSQIKQQFDHVTKRFYAPKDSRSALAEEAQRFTIFTNTPTLRYSMLQRIGFYTQENPNALLGGFSALALHGLTYWVDAAPLTVVTNYQCPRSAPGLLSLVREFDPTPPTCVFELPTGTVQAVTIEHALVSALKDVLRGRCSWFTLPIPSLSPVDVRAIQLIDVVRPFSVDEFFSIARGRVDCHRLKRIFLLSDAHSESPPETLMRLLVVHDTVLGKLSWETQVPILTGGNLGKVGKRYRNIVTIPDLMCRELRIALYFDGAIHRVQEVFERDSRVSGNLHVFGWRSLRVTWGMLRNTEKFLFGLRKMVETAASS